MSRNDRNRMPLPQKWAAFLYDVDAALDAPVELHCIGGFVMTAYYGAPRTTKDLDYIAATGPGRGDLAAIAEAGSELARKHNLYLERVSVANYPEDYETRLEEIFPGELKNLRLLALDPYDLILTKMDRNNDIDRFDAKFLANTLKLTARTFSERYRKEFRPAFVGNLNRLDVTFSLWLEAYFEAKA